MALLFILISLFGLALWGSGSGSTGESSTKAAPPRRATTSHSSTTSRVHVTVRATATARGSTTCSARVRIKGAAVQTSRTCSYSPVKP